MGDISSLFWGFWSTEKRPVRFFDWATGCFAGECLSRGGGDVDGILEVGWPNLLEAEARKTPAPAPAPAPPHTTSRAAAEETREAARGSGIPLAAKTKLDGRQKRAAKDLDPRRTPYHPIPNPSGSEREEQERGQPQQEEQQPEGFQLRPLHHHRNPPPGGCSYFPSPSSSSSSPATASSSDYGHGYGHQQQHQRPRFGGGLRGAGEIVEVQGGHIVRSTGRKDRHSKVCTAKGPRDRRVRLSAHTAIQFYDVQDRLGYDRPSKAVDWLIKNAQVAIDELAKLPSNPPSASNPLQARAAAAAANQPGGDSSKKPIPVAEPVASAVFGFGGGGSGSASFLPPSLDSDAIADTIKSFFPMAAPATAAPSSSPPIGFQNYPSDLASHTSSQDLRLSLQSFHNPIFHNPDPSHHPHSQHHHHQDTTPSTQHALFSGSAHLAYDTPSAGWSEQSQRMVPWNLAEAGGGGGYGFNVPPPAPPQAAPLHPVLGQSQFFTQRGPLQSSNSPAIRAWADPIASTTDNQMHPALRSSASSIGFASVAGYSGFRIPARIQGEEEHDGTSDKPPSASSASHH